MKKMAWILMGLMVMVSRLQAVKLVTDNLPGLPGQSDAYWTERRQKQVEQQKEQGQFVNLREVAVKQAVTYQENEPVNFYTGKPYDVELGAYVFKYRNYNPEMQRWTTVDPSGFPDGANNYLYALSPLVKLDPDGFQLVADISVSCVTFMYTFETVVIGTGGLTGLSAFWRGFNPWTLLVGAIMIIDSIKFEILDSGYYTQSYKEVDDGAQWVGREKLEEMQDVVDINENGLHGCVITTISWYQNNYE